MIFGMRSFSRKKKLKKDEMNTSAQSNVAKKNMPKEKIDQYLLHLRNNLGYSPKTLLLYRKALTRLLDFTNNISEKTLKEYREQVANLKVSSQTKNLRLIPIRQFIKYLAKMKIAAPAYDELELFDESKEKKILDIPEPETIKYALENAHLVGGERLALILAILCNSGLRISELLSLGVGQLKEQFPLIGKGGKQRVVYCSADIVARVRKYEEGKTGKLFPISARRLNYLFSALATRLGIIIRPHLCRHFFAMETLKKSGNNIVATQEFLGHHSLETTRRYLKYSNGELADIHKKCFG